MNRHRRDRVLPGELADGGAAIPPHAGQDLESPQLGRHRLAHDLIFRRLTSGLTAAASRRPGGGRPTPSRIGRSSVMAETGEPRQGRLDRDRSHPVVHRQLQRHLDLLTEPLPLDRSGGPGFLATSRRLTSTPKSLHGSAPNVQAPCIFCQRTCRIAGSGCDGTWDLASRSAWVPLKPPGGSSRKVTSSLMLQECASPCIC
jgi:hypothetical protein